jgi:hypothetical protein
MASRTLSVVAKAMPCALPHAAALEFQAQLQKEQLLEDQPAVGGRRELCNWAKGVPSGGK